MEGTQRVEDKQEGDKKDKKIKKIEEEEEEEREKIPGQCHHPIHLLHNVV